VSGINVLKSRVFAFAIGAGFAGFAGSLFAHDAAYISSNNFSMWGTIYILVWLAVGGARKMWGPIVGAIAMTLIAELLRMSGIWQALFYSAVLLIVVMAMPQGIVGLVDTIRARIARRGSAPGDDQPAVDGLIEGSG
jgi:ABC-type branched-subunit amino acid transport system permease subunit